MQRGLLLFFSISILMTFRSAVAGTPVYEMTCADYLGSRVVDNNGTRDAERSQAYLAGLQLGISVRQASMANWVHGYLIGHNAVTRKEQGAALDMDSLRSRMRLYCSTNENRTMLQVAQEFIAH